MSAEIKSTVIRIAIIEDEHDLRDGLRALINFSSDFRCTSSFRTMEEALAGLNRQETELVITDIGLPQMNGIDGTAVLRGRYPDLPIVVFTVHDEDDMVFRAICAGANGYLLKSTEPAAIYAAIQDVINGGAPMSPQIARRVFELFRRFSPPAQSDIRLTEQEKRILRLLTEGHHYKTAAVELGISTSTVSFHINNIYEKLQVHSKSEAVARALREKLI